MHTVQWVGDDGARAHDVLGPTCPKGRRSRCACARVGRRAHRQQRRRRRHQRRRTPWLVGRS